MVRKHTVRVNQRSSQAGNLQTSGSFLGFYLVEKSSHNPRGSRLHNAVRGLGLGWPSSPRHVTDLQIMVALRFLTV